MEVSTRVKCLDWIDPQSGRRKHGRFREVAVSGSSTVFSSVFETY